ncbi:DUF1700 domain-containing protein [Lacrimispora sp. JR3]|uniref:DUF1700 domain-containing protein n=1 Tax=Lacrimispora sinapis TaxID=3111456 RepID=UPI00374A56F0
MSREEFMRRLEYLLSDIPDEEKSDAIEYYRDYLEEAGPENEEQVMKEFGSPERIAAIVRTELSGNLKDGGEFTEKGYRDDRFKDPNYQMAKHYDLPETTEESGRLEGEAGEGEKKEKKSQNTNKIAKIIIWILLIVSASPLLLGIGGGIMGLLGGLLGLLAAAVIVAGAVTFAFFVAGAAFIVAGFISMPFHPLGGALLIGIGVLGLGLGFLGLAVCFAFYGKFLPYLFRSCVNMIQNFIDRRRSR